jgi:hypothetical protein
MVAVVVELERPVDFSYLPKVAGMETIVDLLI